MTSEIVQVFSQSLPPGQDTVKRGHLHAILKDLLPTASNEELHALLDTDSRGEDVDFREFVSNLFDGQSLDAAEVLGSNSYPADSVIDTKASACHNVTEQRMESKQSRMESKQRKLSFSSEATEVLGMRQSSKAPSFGNAQDGLGCLPAERCPLPGLRSGQNLVLLMAEAARELLPKRVILVRHGESEGNIDATVYKRKPDNAVELTGSGSRQALEAGKRIKQVVGDEKIQLIVSPFQRTMQTARNILVSIQSQVVNDVKDPRIREQEFGNLQGDDFKKFRKEQKTVGRYFYRFPTGESGADVHARVKSWWHDCVLNLNTRPGYASVDNVIVVTHGLTMRFILMQLFDWSPNTFETMWNAHNCEIYVLKKDLALPGHSPYRLCPEEGDMPRSTVSLNVKFKSGNKELYRLDDYLSVPMPRTRQHEIVKQMLQKQHGLDPAEIQEIDFYGGKYSKRM
mmetsp:Transcript_19954/g.37613  ORF Transcript_19954/g.37613 Transcript_19954/m.37613 type:complete len:456 (+) Transcript_19954:138-1505(+)